MRRLISPIIAVAVGGFLIGIAYRRFLDDPSGASVANYLRSGLHAMLIAVFGLAANLYFNVRASRWLRTLTPRYGSMRARLPPRLSPMRRRSATAMGHII
jgi:hypothetical protein